MFPAGPDCLGGELHLQCGGLARELVESQFRREGRENLIGERGVVTAEAAGVEGDYPGAALVDEPGSHPGESFRQAGGQVSGVIDRLRGLNRTEEQLGREFLAWELAGSAVDRDAPRGRRVELRGA